MEIEIQGIPQSIRPSYQTRIKSAKADLQRYKKLSKDLHAQAARSDLLSRPGMSPGPSSDDPYGTSSDRTRLLAGTALLEDGSRRLMDSQRIALETEEQGADILRSLRGQREQIQNARDTVRTNHLALFFFTTSYSSLTFLAHIVIESGHIHRPCLWHSQEDDSQVSAPLPNSHSP